MSPYLYVDKIKKQYVLQPLSPFPSSEGLKDVHSVFGFSAHSANEDASQAGVFETCM